MDVKSVFTVLLLGAAVTGCTHMTLRDTHSHAYHKSMMAQVIDPSASDKSRELGTLDGKKSEQVMGNYRREKAEVASESLVTGLSN